MIHSLFDHETAWQEKSKHSIKPKEFLNRPSHIHFKLRENRTFGLLQKSDTRVSAIKIDFGYWPRSSNIGEGEEKPKQF